MLPPLQPPCGFHPRGKPRGLHPGDDENLILEGQPYFISSEDMLKSGYLPHDSYDSHIRLYEKPNSQNGVRVIYVPELEWEPDKVKQRY